MTPVRANVRGTFVVQAISTPIVSPGAIARGKGTLITVRSSAFPSSGAMKRRDAVKSVNGAGEDERSRMAVTSTQLQSPGCGSARLRPNVAPACSRIQVERLFVHAL